MKRILPLLMILAAAALVAQLPKPGGSGGGVAIDCTPASYATITGGTATAGKVCGTTDSLYTLIGNGSTWQHYFRGLPVKAVPTSGWTAVNQGSATFTTTDGSAYLYSPTASTGMKAWERTIPSTPYTLEACLAIDVKPSNYWSAGIYVADTGDNKKVVGRIVYDATTFTSGGHGVQMTKQATSSTAPGSPIYASSRLQLYSNFQCLKIVDNGTNLVLSYSGDGYWWRQIHSVSRTDYMTSPASVGLYADFANGDAGWVTFYHWKAE